jgi:hypothetical protein
LADSDSNDGKNIDSQSDGEISSSSSEDEQSSDLNEFETSSEDVHSPPKTKSRFKLNWFSTSFKPQLFDFDPSNSGYSGNSIDNPLAYFELFFDDGPYQEESNFGLLVY